MTDIFEQIWKNSVGLDRLLSAQQSFRAGAFPFFNMKKSGDNLYEIELALSGYGIDDIKITLDGNTLTVKSDGIKSNEDYIYRGFTGKPFERQFTLRDNVFVKAADMYNGVLKIALEHIVPEARKPKEIMINVPQPTKKDARQLLNEDSSF